MTAIDTAPTRVFAVPSPARRRDHASRRRWNALHEVATGGLLASAVLTGLMLGVHAPATSPVRPPAVAEIVDVTSPALASHARQTNDPDARP